MGGIVQAFWGHHVLLATARCIQPIMDGLNLKSELDVSQEMSTEAQNPLDVKGGDKQKSFQIRTLAAIHAGTIDPMIWYNQFVRDLGKSMPFILGIMPMGALRMVLQKVTMEDVMFGSAGNIISAYITLDFVEDMPTTAKAQEVKDQSGISKAEKKAKAKELRISAEDLKGAKEYQEKLGIKG